MESSTPISTSKLVYSDETQTGNDFALPSTPPLSEQSSIESIAPSTPVRQIAFTENADKQTGRIGYLDHDSMIEALKKAFPEMLTDWSQYKNHQFTLRQSDASLPIYAETNLGTEDEEDIHLGGIDQEGRITFSGQEGPLEGFCVVPASEMKPPESEPAASPASEDAKKIADSSSETIEKKEKPENRKTKPETTTIHSLPRRAIGAMGSGVLFVVTAPFRLIWTVVSSPFRLIAYLLTPKTLSASS